MFEGLIGVIVANEAVAVGGSASMNLEMIESFHSCCVTNARKFETPAQVIIIFQLSACIV